MIVAPPIAALTCGESYLSIALPLAPDRKSSTIDVDEIVCYVLSTLKISHVLRRRAAVVRHIGEGEALHITKNTHTGGQGPTRRGDITISKVI